MREEWNKPVGNKFYQPLERIDILGRKTFVAAAMRLFFVEGKTSGQQILPATGKNRYFG
jgi:hypothetical protein